MKLLFWALVACDTAVLLLLFVLGLAAAPSSRTSPLAVAAYMLGVPFLVLTIAIVLFVRGNSVLARSVALLMAASPVLILFTLRTIESAKLRLNTDDSGKLTNFHSGEERQIADAIDRNDAVTVKALATKANVNTTGYRGTTLLLQALQHQKPGTTNLEVLAALLAAGANPNIGAPQLPLEIAIQQSRETGHLPVLMLLTAGANPNVRDQFGTPLFFAGAGKGVDPQVLGVLLEHGAELSATDGGKRTIAFQAANNANWEAVLFLLQRGVDYKSARTLNNQTFGEMTESYARTFGDTAGVKEVLEYLKTHQ